MCIFKLEMKKYNEATIDYRLNYLIKLNISKT